MKHRLIPYAILTFLSLITGYITGNNIFYILFTAFLAVGFLALLSLFVSYTQLSYVQKLEPKEGIKGETCELLMNIHNNYIFPLPYVEIEYDLPDESLNLYPNKKSFGIQGSGKVTIAHNVYCRYRGTWNVGLSKIRIYDMFGLFHVTLDFYLGTNYRVLKLYIKPRIVPLESLPLPFKENITSNAPARKNTYDTAEISDIRQYASGDILKKIHWKLSLAKQDLLVKNNAFSLDPDTYIYMDCSAHSLEGAYAIELEDMLTECAAAVSNHVFSLGLPTKFVVVGGERKETGGASPDDFAAVYQDICELDFREEFSFFELFTDELSAISQVNSIFIITHNIDPKGYDSLVYLRQAQVDVTILLVKAGTWKNDSSNKMTEELRTLGVIIITVLPGDDLNAKIKEQWNEKKTF